MGTTVGLGVAGGVEAQGLITMRMLSAPLANELVGDAVASCAQQGYAVTAVVVDLDGVRQALLRGNGAPIHTVDYAFNKAYSAATLTLARKEDSTKAVAERMSKNPRGYGPSGAAAKHHLCSWRSNDHRRRNPNRCHWRQRRARRKL